jgi:hypothetical protein
MGPGQSLSQPPSVAAPVQPPTKVDKGESSATKAEMPGQQAKPLQQVGAMPPQAPTKQPKQQQKPAKLPALKVAKAEMLTRCPICQQPQFSRGAFTGCYCLRDLAKNVRLDRLIGGDVLLRFGARWDLPAIEVLIEALHGPQS